MPQIPPAGGRAYSRDAGRKQVRINRSIPMSKKFVEVNGRYYFVDDETGEICQILVKEAVVPPKEDIAAIIKLVSGKADA
jgi:hypothetical protein